MEKCLEGIDVVEMNHELLGAVTGAFQILRSGYLPSLEASRIVSIQKRLLEYKMWREFEVDLDHRNLAYIFPASATCGVSPSKKAAQRFKGWGASYLGHSRCTVAIHLAGTENVWRGPCFSSGDSMGGSSPTSIA